MVNDAAEGTIKFASDFTSVIMTNRARWQATMHEVETQKFTLEPKKQCFFKILVKIALDYAYFYFVFSHNSYIYKNSDPTELWFVDFLALNTVV